MTLLNMLFDTHIAIPEPQIDLNLSSRQIKLYDIFSQTEPNTISEKAQRQLAAMYKRQRQTTRAGILESMKQRVRKVQKREPKPQACDDVYFNKLMQKLVALEQDSAQSDE